MSEITFLTKQESAIKSESWNNKRKSWYLSFFSLGDEVGSNFDIICKEEAREETTIGIPFSQFVKVAAMMGTDVGDISSNLKAGWIVTRCC